MMGRQSRQMAMIFVDIESLIPETHLLRKIERMVSFNSFMIFWRHIIRQQAVHLSTLSVCSKCS